MQNAHTFKTDMTIQSLISQYQKQALSVKPFILECRQRALDEHDLNAWIYILSEEELQPYFEQLEDKTPESLPLYGIPFAIKDNIDLNNIRTTAACPDFKYTASESAFVVQKLIQAGAIPIGKTNLDQFATGLVGTRSPYGQGKNVFNPEYCSGGSSSGSAIATALGHVSFALGTDTAGSGRVPAAFNNLIGHKPTKGLLSTSGVVPACRSLDCVSIFSLSSEDAARVFKTAAQFDPSDAYARKNKYHNNQLFQGSGIKKHFKFAIPENLEFHGNRECEEMFSQAISHLQELGGEMEKIDFSTFTLTAKLLYEGPWVAERWLATQNVPLDQMLPVIQDIIGNGNHAKASDAFSAQYQLAEYKRVCDNLVNQYEFILTPTTPTTFKRSDIDKNPIELNSILGTYTNFMNLLDYSATSIPIGQTNAGPYWGVTLFSEAFSDMRLLNYTAALQKVLNLPLGASAFPYKGKPTDTHRYQNTIDVAVCGAHLTEQPLNWQLTERDGKLKKQTLSSKHYKLYALPDGKRPGMKRVEEGGAHIDMEIWSIPTESFGSFVANIPAPLGIGKVELMDGSWCTGFICEAYGLKDAEDITEFKGWKQWLSSNRPNQQ